MLNLQLSAENNEVVCISAKTLHELILTCNYFNNIPHKDFRFRQQQRQLGDICYNAISNVFLP